MLPFESLANFSSLLPAFFSLVFTRISKNPLKIFLPQYKGPYFDFKHCITVVCWKNAQDSPAFSLIYFTEVFSLVFSFFPFLFLLMKSFHWWCKCSNRKCPIFWLDLMASLLSPKLISDARASQKPAKIHGSTKDVQFNLQSAEMSFGKPA